MYLLYLIVVHVYLFMNIKIQLELDMKCFFAVYKDKNVSSPFKEDFSPFIEDESSCAAREDHIYMDAMGFGMGCCCLQLTFQACNIEEARTLYDQLTPLCPIMVSNM